MSKKIRVLIVDDSALVRQTLTGIYSSDPDIEVIGAAGDPFVAADIMRDQIPDVISLDVEMPRMDGITFLKKIMTQHPVPTIICSTLTEKNAETTMKALEYGAVSVIQKPKVGTKQFKVATAINGQEALDLAKSNRYDLIVMDIQMPVLDGVTATNIIRAASDMASPPDIPIIAMTAYAMSGDKERFLQAGMNDYLSKPVRMEDLRQAIKTTIAGLTANSHERT